jgi:hypothetical protein
MTKPALNLSHPLYSLEPVVFESREVTLRFVITAQMSTTAQMHGIVEMLEALQPSVLQTKCFNDKHQSFRKEVKNTETAHLFEHLLLDCLMQIKLERGAQRATFRGETSWNWIEFPPGTFEIQVKMCAKDRQLLPEALIRAAQVFNALLPSSVTH